MTPDHPLSHIGSAAIVAKGHYESRPVVVRGKDEFVLFDTEDPEQPFRNG